MTSEKSRKKNIVFLHPDLGIGGAERLVVDAAVGLQSLGHRVTIFTSHCDPQHCFDEARDGSPPVLLTHACSETECNRHTGRSSPRKYNRACQCPWSLFHSVRNTPPATPRVQHPFCT